MLSDLNTKRSFSSMPALLALLGVLLWPALAGATCCCKRASIIAAASGLDSVCCVAAASKASCCTAENPPSCYGAGSDCPVQSHAGVEEPDCRCGIDCCQADLHRLRLVVPENKIRIVGIDVQVDSFDAAYAAKAVDFSLPKRDSFQSAPDHCAQVCVWLK